MKNSSSGSGKMASSNRNKPKLIVLSNTLWPGKATTEIGILFFQANTSTSEFHWTLICLPGSAAQFSDKHSTFLATGSVMNVFVINALNDKYVVCILSINKGL